MTKSCKQTPELINLARIHPGIQPRVFKYIEFDLSAQNIEPCVLKGLWDSQLDASSELCSPFLKGGNSTFIAAIVNGLFPQTEYRSLK